MKIIIRPKPERMINKGQGVEKLKELIFRFKNNAAYDCFGILGSGGAHFFL
ncbi:MAG: hypothetical protein Q4D19_10840 [Lautropia sp.]|nr:hypothetical protein [Lautropia sp.]